MIGGRLIPRIWGTFARVQPLLRGGSRGTLGGGIKGHGFLKISGRLLSQQFHSQRDNLVTSIWRTRQTAKSFTVAMHRSSLNLENLYADLYKSNGDRARPPYSPSGKQPMLSIITTMVNQIPIAGCRTIIRDIRANIPKFATTIITQDTGTGTIILFTTTTRDRPIRRQAHFGTPTSPCARIQITPGPRRVVMAHLESLISGE
jgi:hypothetical protein